LETFRRRRLAAGWADCASECLTFVPLEEEDESPFVGLLQVEAA
jgi:hypothetical protein